MMLVNEYYVTWQLLSFEGGILWTSAAKFALFLLNYSFTLHTQLV